MRGTEETKIDTVQIYNLVGKVYTDNFNLFRGRWTGFQINLSEDKLQFQDMS